MEINLTKKQQDVLKKIFQTEDIEPIVQKVVADWLANQIQLKFSKTKSINEMIDELNKETKK